MHKAFLIGLAALLAGCTAVTPPSPSPTMTESASPSTPAPSSPAASSPVPTQYPFQLAELPRIDGSTANIPLIALTIQRLTGVSQTEAENTVATTGTPNAWRNLLWGDTDLLIVYEADQQVQAEVADSEVKLEAHPLGRDALVFFTNAANPVTSLTTEQYRDIYLGTITNWSQVGGREVEIVAYQRPEESGSQALLRKFVVGDAELAPAPSERVAGSMGDIIEAVSSYSNTANALGYSVYYYLANMYAVEGIAMLAADGVAPSSQTIGDGSYPYANDFYVVVRADEPAGSPARRVMEWLLGADGRQAVTDAGYVPVG